MSRVGERALSGETERISAKCFEIKEDMLMIFEGQSCNITDNKDEPIFAYGSNDGEVRENVKAGYKCYVMRAHIKFKRKES